VTPKRPRDGLILLALWLMVFSASSQVIIVAPILPRIGEALGVPVSLQGLLITSYAVFVAISALISGPVSDRVGRRRILMFGTAALSAALFLHAFAFDFGSLLFFRALAGAAGGMLSGAAVAFVGDYFPYDRRGWANGWVMSGIAFGQIIGIPLGTILADTLGFRWAFLMFAITMGMASLFIWLVVPQPEVRRDTSQLSLIHIGRRYRSLLGRRETLAACISYFLMFFSIGLFVTYLPTWLESHLGVSGTHIASLFLVGGIANVLSGPASGRLSDRVGRKPLVLASCIGMGFVMIATTLVVDTMLAAYTLFSLAMVTVGMRISPLQALLTALVRDQRRGTLMALAIACGQAGIGLGSLVAGATYVPYGYGVNTFIGATGILIMAAVVHTMIPEPSGDHTVVNRTRAA
jgi:predicted MFS family arabinose efflux permease